MNKIIEYKIEVKDFENWINKEHEIIYASSYGRGTDKVLIITTNNLIKVRDHNVIIYEGKNINDAVKIYNECK